MAEIRIFISSVQSEFAAERRALYRYICEDALLGKFFEPFLFENLPAQDQSAERAYLTEAAQCTIYLGIMGEKYGFEDKNGVSPTEHEYDTATQNHAYRLVYIKDCESRHKKEQLLIDKVEKDVIRHSFRDYDDLRTAVYASLIRYLEEKEVVRRYPFDMTPHPTATIGQLDNKKIQTFVERAWRKRKIQLPIDKGIEAVLSAIHVLTDDGRLTNAALLLFAKDPQGFFRPSEIKCAQFYGTKVEKPIKNYQVYEGDVFELVDQAVGFVMSRVDAKVGTRDKHTDVDIDYELPESAVTEAIVNAVAHRDYTSNQSVQVMLFRDRLEIWNPGHLPYGLTPAKLRELHSSDPVNPVLAYPMFLTGHIDHLGTGTTDIIESCVAKGLKSPEFIQTEEFRTIIWRKDYTEIDSVNMTDNNNLNDSEIDANCDSVSAIKTDSVKVLQSDRVKPTNNVVKVRNRILIKKILIANPYVTLKELSQMIGITERNVSGHIQRLKEKDGLRRVGSDKCGHWEFD